MASWAVTRGAGWTSYETYGLEARLAMTGYSFWFYPWKLVWPEGSRRSTSFPPASVSPTPQFLWPTVGVLVVTAILLLARRRVPGALAAWLHSMIVLAPVSGIAHAGHQLAHDRYSYLSGLGFAVLAGTGVTWLGRQRARGQVSRWVLGATVTAMVLALAGLGAGTWTQSRIWRDSESLWRSAVTADPTCALCRQKLGGVLQTAGLHREAEAELTRAVALRPDRPTARNSLGTFLVDQGRLDEAETEFREAVRLAPTYSEATANLGALYARQRKHAEAILTLRRAVALAPHLDSARGNLAFALDSAGVDLARDGKAAEAVGLFREATELLPAEVTFWRNLGQALIDDGKSLEAVLLSSEPWPSSRGARPNDSGWREPTCSRASLSRRKRRSTCSEPWTRRRQGLFSARPPVRSRGLGGRLAPGPFPSTRDGAWWILGGGHGPSDRGPRHHPLHRRWRSRRNIPR